MHRNMNKRGKSGKNLRDSITHYITKDCLPINVLEGTSLNTLDLRYEIPGQNQFSRIALPSFCASVKQRVKQDVSTLQCFLATTDM